MMYATYCYIFFSGFASLSVLGLFFGFLYYGKESCDGHLLLCSWLDMRKGVVNVKYFVYMRDARSLSQDI